MVHTDRIVKDLDLVYEGVFDFKEFISFLKDYFKRNDYDIDEKLYDTKIKNGLKSTKIKWECDRKLDDYNKALAKLSIELIDYKEGYVDGIKVVDGKIKLGFNGDLERDYDAKWKVTPKKRFIRAIYDKYVKTEKQSTVEGNLKSLIENLLKEVKQYFKV